MFDPGMRFTSSGRTLFSRRSFVKLVALAAVPVPRFLAGAAEILERLGEGSGGAARPILVTVQLSGGNDGLNTVIPCEDSRYHAARPSLAVRENEVLRFENGGPLGFHPQMKSLHELYREGKLAVIQGAGYPNPDRSHFRSMEIWHTANPDRLGVQEGWLGRTIARQKLEAIDIGDNEVPLALAADGIQVPALQNLNWLDTLFTARGAELRQMLLSFTERRRSGDLEFLRGAVQSTFTQLEQLEKIRGRPAPVEYPQTSLGKRLQWTGQLIEGGFPSRIYYLSMDGFDTHAQQKDPHAQLLKEFSDGVAAFFKHLSRIGKAEQVALMAFSEFGRRVRENGSLGTDHGCAAPMFVASGAARGGLVGGPPDLADLDQGDLRYQVDFRRVYATVLEEVLQVEAKGILGGAFEKLPLLKMRQGELRAF